MAVQMELARIIISDNNEQQIVYLKEVDGDRQFPIVIGYFEATSINRRVQGQHTPRPLTHDLLANAIDALGANGTITLRTRRDGECVLVDIADTGPGIPPEARAHVFEPFFTTKGVGQGTGLGLETARRIVEERHGGTLSFDTGERGTTFHVWLPLNLPTPGETETDNE